MVNQTLAESIEYKIMTVAAIVQARSGSSRFPGKVLEMIGEKPALLWCLDRCRQIPGVDGVVCAVPDTAKDDEVAELAADFGYFVTRGSENDVLGRYAKAAREIGATTILRVTSDCPLIDPHIAGQVLDLLFSSGVDYSCNNLPPKFPHGLDCEAFSAEILFAADQQANSSYEWEHVTPWIRNHPSLTKVNLLGPGGGLQEMRWTLDQPEDLAYFRALNTAYPEDACNASAAELAAFCLRRPDLGQINQQFIDHDRLAKQDRANLQSAPSRMMDAA